MQDTFDAHMACIKYNMCVDREVGMEFKPVVFSVNEQKFAVDINCVRGIEKVQNVVRVPNSNKDIKGIINLRGDVIPIYSLRRHFGFDEATYTEDTKFIIVYVDGVRIGLEVDAVEEIHKVEEEMMNDIPIIVKKEETNFFNKIIKVEKDLILVIDIEKILSDEQLVELKKIIEDK